MEYVIKPKKAVFKSETLNEKEIENLLKVCNEAEIKISIYSLFLWITQKWKRSAIYYESDIITARRSVTNCRTKNGTVCRTFKDETKTSSSYRSFPLLKEIKEILIEQKQ